MIDMLREHFLIQLVESIGGGSGYIGPRNVTNVIDFVTIATTGNAQDFGDLTQAKYLASGCASVQLEWIILGW